MSDRHTYKQYVRHAELYGVADLYEVAAADLTPRELVQLVGQMRRIDAERHRAERTGNVRHRIEPTWRFPREQARELVGRLGAEPGRVDVKWVSRMLGIAPQTVRSYLQAALEAAESDETEPSQVPGPPSVAPA